MFSWFGDYSKVHGEIDLRSTSQATTKISKYLRKTTQNNTLTLPVLKGYCGEMYYRIYDAF
jgi:hypothetical protein